MIENMLYQLENGNLQIDSKLTQLKHQLSMYHRVRKKSGRTSYSKKNDDCVDSLMLALWGLKEEGGTPGESEWLHYMCQ